MSNLAGSYKVGAGEAQGVDLREQERRARLLLLDGIREPSPQPIFGEPVKVELEDETSRRIKNTLGDVTEVLMMNDSKNLMCISRSTPTSGYPSNGHQIPGHPSNSHPMSGLPSNSHPLPGHPSSSHQLSGHLNSHLMSGNPSNSHPMSGHSSNSHSMSGNIPNSHLVSGHQSNSHPMSGQQSSTHLMTGNQSNVHSVAGHQSNTHPITGHSSSNHLISGHSSSSHSVTGHPSSSHLPGHTSNSHLISGHPTNSHPIPGHPTSGHPGHPSNSHQIPGHPLNSHPIPGHPTTGHPSNSHPIPGHTTGGHPSNGYHVTGHPLNVHPIPGHPSNGHPISGYTATGYSGAGHVNAPSRPQAASKKVPVPANNANVSKPPTTSMPNMFSKVAPDKRNTYNRQKPDSPVSSKPLYTSNFNNVASTQHQALQQQYQTQDTKAWNAEQKKSSNAPFTVNMDFNSGNYNNVTVSNVSINNVSTSTLAPIWSCGPETPAIQMNPFHLPPCATPSTANKPVYNIPGQNGIAPNMQQMPKFDPSNNTPLKRPVVRPSHLKIERKPTSPIGVETILKEMTKPVPAPLTAIQTPRTEETGFAFPPEPKEELPFVKVDEKANPSSLSHEQEPMDICQPSPTPQIKPVSPFPNLQSQNQQFSQPLQQHGEPPKVSEYTSSLQDDLEMSESDDEVVPEKKEDPTEYLKSPSNNPVIVNSTPAPVNNTNMDANSASSSSSESGDSDSDDDSSESNNSDSSSDSSDEDTSSMKWGLSNFVDESRRNHSPAFRSLEMQKQLNSAKTTDGLCPAVLKDNFSPPVSQPVSELIVADTPVTAKSDILSPIRSPAHPVVGPRTPPSPACSTKELSEGNEGNTNVSEIQPENSLTEGKSSNNTLGPPNEIKVSLSGVIPVACDEIKENTAANTSSDVLSSEGGSSPLLHSSADDLNEHKDIHKVISEKDNSLAENKSSPSSDALDSSHENYPIKTRQKGATSAKKTKSANGKKVSDSNQNGISNSPPIAKFKHPRACRKSNEKPTTPVSAAKTEQVKEPKKRSKPAVKQKEVVSSEKNKSPQKPAGGIKKPAKTTVKQKTKTTKTSPKPNVEGKKGDVKSKKKKFNVENFLQSPISTCNLPSPSPSPEKLPVIECKKHTDTVVKPSNSTIPVSKTAVKSNSKTSNKSKNVEKLRRSVRCSERASSLTQTETSTTPKQNGEHASSFTHVEGSTTPKSSTGKNKKPVKKSVKSKSHVENLPISIDPPLQILSPIPHDSPAAASTSEQGSQKKIMVCIPLSKLLRIPTFLHQIQEPDPRIPSKSHSIGSAEEVKPKKEASAEKSFKTVTNKCSQSKDFKDKPRTVQTQKKKSVSVSKKENTSKTLSEISSKPASIVNKNSAKTADKTICDVENKLPKKRKIEGDTKQISKKKPKLSLRSVEEKKSKEQITVTKTESSASQNDIGGKPKPLERCDSASSLNSLCSQRSSKSSKDKKDISVIHESKRLKTSMLSSIPVKEIKQEKEDRPKAHIKKEPSATIDKSMKSRDKSASDVDCKEKGDSWSDTLNTSSQYCHWDDTCKDDSKLPLDSIIDNLNRDSTMNWDHFSPDMHKELKEASALKMLTDQGPIMPMDYYWTEGRKMKKMAEMEKDPFQQAVKFFEAAVLYVLTSQQKEENSKNPDAVYQFYYETLSFTTMMLSKIKKLQSCPGSTEFKLLILCLKCQSLLNVKLYSLKIKEIKEQLEGVSDFFRLHCSSPIEAPNPNLPSLHQSRISNLSTVSSPHSVISPSPSSAGSQTSGYVSGEVGGAVMRNTVCVSQTVLDTIYRQHTHFKNLHMGHDLWEQADMYMTRSNLKEFFKEVADQSEPLTLHSTIKELVSYMQKGIGLVKNYLR